MMLMMMMTEMLMMLMMMMTEMLMMFTDAAVDVQQVIAKVKKAQVSSSHATLVALVPY